MLSALLLYYFPLLALIVLAEGILTKTEETRRGEHRGDETGRTPRR